MYYDDSEDDMEDFKMHPKKLAKMMRGMKVSFVMCCCFSCYILYFVILYYIILYYIILYYIILYYILLLVC